jgi:MHS family proline/betaine transporter-like MFS transporter
MMPQQKRRLLIAMTIGNVLEFYDFLVFAFLLPIFAGYFFPQDAPGLALLKSYMIFAVGFVTRPLGGLMIGALGDRYGRKLALTLSILCMAVATSIIGCLPGYATIGVWAPILLVCCRLVQGICAGGEYNGSGLMMLEHAKAQDKYLYTAIISVSATVGGLLASLVSMVFILPSMPEWGWRIPFLCGGMLGAVGLYLRRTAEESPEFAYDHRYVGFFKFLGQYWGQALCTLGIGGFAVAPFYTLFIYIPSLLMHMEQHSKVLILLMNSMLMLASVVVGVLCGKLTQRFAAHRLMLAGGALTLLLAIPLYGAVATGQLGLIMLIGFVFNSASQLFGALSLGYLSLLFSPAVRYRGSAFFYNLGVALFCGTLPMLSEALRQAYDAVWAPAYYLAALAVMGGVATVVGRRYQRGC